jgi:type I restriction enzyme, S subunit
VKFPAYPRTKPSGVEWLGDVPEHWALIPLRRTSTRYTGGTPDRSNDSYWEDGTIPWINSGAVNQGLITEPSAFITQEAYQNSSARWVANGALVMALAGQGKTKGIVAQTGIATTCNQSMAAICPAPPTEARYLYWLLVSQYEHIRNMAGGEARDGLNLEILGSIPCLKAPPAEQRTIAAFLDRETGRVDRLVAKKRELIERLKEKRTALISRTVTRGLPPGAGKKYPQISQIYADEMKRPKSSSENLRQSASICGSLPENPPLKPSGVEWLGEIPKHWEVAQLRRKAHILDCKHRTVPFIDDGIPLASIREVHGFEVDLTNAKQTSEDEYLTLIEGDRRPRVGDIIYSRNATVGDAALVATKERFCMGQDVCLIRAPKHHAKFLLFLFRSPPLMEQVESLMIGSTFRRINVGQIHAFWICVPPLPEQAAIAAYLDEETAKLDALVGKVEEAVDRLQEYRTALITAAVTGKIDVRTTVRHNIARL